MKFNAKEVISQMSPEVKKQVSVAARKKDMSIEKFVQNQLKAELVDNDFVLQSENIDWDVGVDVSPTRGDTRVGGRIGGRF